MSAPNPIKILFSAWPTRQALADEIGADVSAVHKWAQNGRIPSDWQMFVQKAAVRRGLEYATAEWMLEIHCRPALSGDAA